VHQDVRLFAGLLAQGERVGYDVPAGRHAWIHVARGSVELAGERLEAGDAAALSESGKLELRGASAAEVLVFDLG
jgi:hypothetical protein